MTNDLQYLFYPRSIALVGISTNPAKFGGGFWMNVLLELGYSGKIYPVNPKLDEFNGIKVYPTVRDIPESVDLVIVTIPAHLTIQLMEDCAYKGVKFVQFYTAGFSETGEEEGIKMEKELLKIAKRGGIRIIGPNCMGVYCPKSGICWRYDFPKKSGPLGIMAQSGWNAVEIVKLGAIHGVLCSELISYGNASDLNESDFLEYFASDSETKVVASYIEGVKNGRRFFSILSKVSKIKPYIVLKGGRTDAGTRAVASHTSSLAGTNEIWNAVIKQSGAIGVSSFDELIDTVIACLYMKVPKNRKVGLIGSGGGPSVTAADECESSGLQVPPFPDSIRQNLNKFMPKEGTSSKNPIDSPFVWDPDMFGKTIRTVAECTEIGSLIVHAEIDSTVLFVGRKLIAQITQSIIDNAKKCGKPVAFVLRSVGTPEAKQVLQEEQEKFLKQGLPLYPSISRASKAIDNLIEYNRRLQEE
ncbi:MAG: CoA-binding protein [Thermodesulfobacteriota bacterium]|nr:CoA-binding protein [Thermodesulfobacteriota bacterium]